MAIKTYHEAPKSIFKEVQKITDGDYALVHLFEEDEEYYNLFKDAIAEGREVILDNSIFELEEAFDADKFAKWIDKLRPTWYIVPDALEDGLQTMIQMATWNEKYKNLPGKKIGVVQGKNYNQIAACYEYMDKIANVDMIAISFDYSYYEETFPHPNKHISWTMGRAKLLGDLLSNGVINIEKKHHLLGIGLPVEGKLYSTYPWIYSIDTSNPVVHAIKGIKYEENFGLYTKESQKLFELINYSKSEINLELVEYNINEFRKYWNGKAKE